jgi:hypothetical protein
VQYKIAGEMIPIGIAEVITVIGRRKMSKRNQKIISPARP